MTLALAGDAGEQKYVVPYNPKSMAPSEHEMMVFHTMAEQAVTSKMYKGIGDQAGVMMIMLSARELGIPPMQSLNGGLNIINGKVEISARMMNALIRKSGHQIKVVSSNDIECVLQGRRCDSGETLTTSFTYNEAVKAGLVKPNGGWTKWPKDMCFARALSRLARQLFSDVIGMGYVEGEISGIEIKPMEAASTEIQEHAVEKEVTLEEEGDPEYIEKFLSYFENGDKFLAMEYLDLVMKHFSWTKFQAIQELLKDEKRLFLKFQAWKDKVKKTEEG
jgi:hypothetical protein